MVFDRKNPHRHPAFRRVLLAGVALGAMSPAFGANDLGTASIGNGSPLGIVAPGISYHTSAPGGALFVPFDGFMFCTNVHSAGNDNAITFYPEHRTASGSVWELPAVQDIAGFRYGAQGGSVYLVISRVESSQSGDGKPSLVCHPVHSEGVPFSPLADGVMRGTFEDAPFRPLPPMDVPNEFVRASVGGVDAAGLPSDHMLVQVNGNQLAYLVRVRAQSSLVPSINIVIRMRDSFDKSQLSATGQYCGFNTLPDPGNIDLSTICEDAGAAVGNIPASGKIDVNVSLTSSLTSRTDYVVVRRTLIAQAQDAGGGIDGTVPAQPVAAAAIFTQPVLVPGYGDVADQFIGDNVVFGFRPGSD